MASEEDALERQEKQICLRAPAVPLLGTCFWWACTGQPIHTLRQDSGALNICYTGSLKEKKILSLLHLFCKTKSAGILLYGSNFNGKTVANREGREREERKGNSLLCSYD